jgi:hypothetical protein
VLTVVLRHQRQLKYIVTRRNDFIMQNHFVKERETLL